MAIFFRQLEQKKNIDVSSSEVCLRNYTFELLITELLKTNNTFKNPLF